MLKSKRWVGFIAYSLIVSFVTTSTAVATPPESSTISAKKKILKRQRETIRVDQVREEALSDGEIISIADAILSVRAASLGKESWYGEPEKLEIKPTTLIKELGLPDRINRGLAKLEVKNVRELQKMTKNSFILKLTMQPGIGEISVEQALERLQVLNIPLSEGKSLGEEMALEDFVFKVRSAWLQGGESMDSPFSQRAQDVYRHLFKYSDIQSRQNLSLPPDVRLKLFQAELYGRGNYERVLSYFNKTVNYSVEARRNIFSDEGFLLLYFISRLMDTTSVKYAFKERRDFLSMMLEDVNVNFLSILSPGSDESDRLHAIMQTDYEQIIWQITNRGDYEEAFRLTDNLILLHQGFVMRGSKSNRILVDKALQLRKKIKTERDEGSKGESLGEAKSLQDLKNIFPESAFILQKLAHPSSLREELLLKVYNRNRETNSYVFRMFLNFVAYNEPFFFKKFPSIMTMTLIRKVFRKNLVWFTDILQLIVLNEDKFLKLAGEDFIGKQRMRKHFQDPEGFIDSVYSTTQDEKSAEDLGNPELVGRAELRQIFSKNVKNFQTLRNLRKNREGLTVRLEKMSSQNLKTLFANSDRMINLVESSKRLREYQRGTLREPKDLITGVFQGGGAKGVAYVGVLEELEKQNTWFRRVAGTSAGAIVAALIAVGYTPVEIRKIMFETDFRKFKDLRWGFMPGLMNLVATGGMYKGDAFEKWLEDLLIKNHGRKFQVSGLTIRFWI